MIYIIILLFILVIANHLILHNLITRMAKYQNFKNNVALRIMLKKEMKELEAYEEASIEAEDTDEMRIVMERRNELLDTIKEKINIAIDEELDNSDWKETTIAINSEVKYFHIDDSTPFHQVFNKSILERFNKRNTK